MQILRPGLASLRRQILRFEIEILHRWAPLLIVNFSLRHACSHHNLPTIIIDAAPFLPQIDVKSHARTQIALGLQELFSNKQPSFNFEV